MEAVMTFLRDPTWSPYAAGIGIGILSWLTFYFSDHPLGVSTAYAKTAGMLEKAARGPKVDTKPYYQEHKPALDWEWMLVLGLFLGAFAAAALSDTVQWEWIPPMWVSAFGENLWARLGVALLGGVCVGFGARWGRGCTSGHGISGALQLVLSSWIATFCFFVGGVATALFLYRILV